MDVVKIYNTTITCEGVSVVVLSLSLRKKGSSVFGDRGNVSLATRTMLLNCACVINTNAHVVMNRLKPGSQYDAGRT